MKSKSLLFIDLFLIIVLIFMIKAMDKSIEDQKKILKTNVEKIIELNIKKKLEMTIEAYNKRTYTAKSLELFAIGNKLIINNAFKYNQVKINNLKYSTTIIESCFKDYIDIAKSHEEIVSSVNVNIFASNEFTTSNLNHYSNNMKLLQDRINNVFKILEPTILNNNSDLSTWLVKKVKFNRAISQKKEDDNQRNIVFEVIFKDNMTKNEIESFTTKLLNKTLVTLRELYKNDKTTLKTIDDISIDLQGISLNIPRAEK